MWWIVPISIVMLLLALLLFAPVELEIDSTRDTYRVRWWIVFTAQVIPVESDILLEGRMLGFRKRWSLLEMMLSKEEKKRARKKKKEKKRRSGRRKLSLKTLMKLLSSFTVERFDISVDTGSVMWNAMLFPMAEILHYSLRQKHPGFRINFKGIQYIDLKISNRGLNVVRAFIH